MSCQPQCFGGRLVSKSSLWIVYSLEESNEKRTSMVQRMKLVEKEVVAFEVHHL